jgi:signal transduction histidine kinase
MTETVQSRSSRKGIVIAATVLALAVVLNGVIGVREIRAIVANFNAARRDGNTRISLDTLLYDLLTAETGRRRFFYTGDALSLEAYESAVQRIPADLARIDSLTLLEPPQQARLRILRPLVFAWLAETHRTIHQQHVRGSNTARSDLGTTLPVPVRTVIAAMTNEEERQRNEARLKSDASATRALETVIASSSLATIFVFVTFVQFGIAARAEKNARKQMQAALMAETRAREDSEALNRLRDQFIANVSHELRTPLTAILGWSAILTSGDADPSTVTEGLAAIQGSASVQKRLIEDLLDVSRIITGKLQLSMRTLDLSNVVRVAIDSIRPAAGAKSIIVITDLEPGIRISGDPDRLQQVVWNLTTNAVKFTPHAGMIAVTVRRDHDRSLLEVRDSGEGIDASFLPHLFEPFRQSDPSRATLHGGLGLGLSIAKYLVEAHGGTIAVWSAGKDKGSTFCVSLPVVPSHTGETSDEEVIASRAEDVNAAMPRA